MAEKTIQMIVKKRLRWHKTEVAVLWFIIAVGAVLVVIGIGVYLHVGELTITQYLSTIAVQNFVVSQVKMLCDFAKALGAVFCLLGMVAMIFAVDRLSLAKSAHTMASYIQKAKENLGEDLREDIPKNS